MDNPHLKYLGHYVGGLPPSFVLQGRKLKPKFEKYRSQGVIKVLVGPDECGVVLNIKRPYRSHGEIQ